MALTRADLLLRRPKIFPVTFSDGATVYIRELSAKAWVDLRKRDPEDRIPGLAPALVLCDEGGTLLYNPDNPDDVKECSELPLADTNKILQAMMAKSRGEDIKEEASKN